MNAKVRPIPNDEIPLPCPYGAMELKGIIRKSTLRGLFSTLILMVLLFFAIAIANVVERTAQNVFGASLGPINIDNFDPQESTGEIETYSPPPPIDKGLNSGPVDRAGTPKPIPDAEASPDMKRFATVDKIGFASSEGGDGTFENEIAGSLEVKPEVKVEVQTREVEPDPEIFQEVEKEPSIDLARLMGLVKYPELARKANIEGKVTLRILIGKDGSVMRILIEHSDNQLLNSAAEEAIRNYGNLTPAIQNGTPTMCWVSIPIRFRLR